MTGIITLSLPLSGVTEETVTLYFDHDCERCLTLKSHVILGEHPGFVAGCPGIFGMLHFTDFISGHTKSFSNILNSLVGWVTQCNVCLIKSCWRGGGKKIRRNKWVNHGYYSDRQNGPHLSSSVSFPVHWWSALAEQPIRVIFLFRLTLPPLNHGQVARKLPTRAD